jgi:hypothetical protein
VDLIAYYYRYLGTTTPGGNGKDYATNKLPDGWTRIQYYSGFVPQPGDIAVWTTGGGGYGHVAIVTEGNASTFSVVEQNWGHSYCTSRTKVSTSAIWGVVRPDFEKGNDPQGMLDICEGGVQSVTVKGWAFDQDSVDTSLAIHVYIGGNYDSGGTGYVDNVANQLRADVESAYPGVGNYHGYDFTVQTSLTGKQDVYVYAINVGGGQSTLLGTQTVYIQEDTQAPVISDVKVINMDKTGYTVSCKVVDETGVNVV